MNTQRRIDARAAAMSDDERNDYLQATGWIGTAAGWIPPRLGDDITATHDDGSPAIASLADGVLSRSSAIREQLAREAGATPNRQGRCYRGSAPAGSEGKRW